ncbi:hypothetical protein B0H19DRAFT_1260413 [Mycena capillaripes]|nr:hypothetical protein B0H19DRAFT_1260413 [Mycena capillaripes]
MHFVVNNYLRIIVCIAALARATFVYGTPIAKTARAVEEVTARDPSFGGPGRVADEYDSLVHCLRPPTA